MFCCCFVVKVCNKLPPRCPPSEPPSYSRQVAQQRYAAGDEWIEPLDVGPDLEPIQEEPTPRFSDQRLVSEGSSHKRGSRSPNARSKSRSPSGSRPSTPSKVTSHEISFILISVPFCIHRKRHVKCLVVCMFSHKTELLFTSLGKHC